MRSETGVITAAASVPSTARGGLPLNHAHFSVATWYVVSF